MSFGKTVQWHSHYRSARAEQHAEAREKLERETVEYLAKQAALDARKRRVLRG